MINDGIRKKILFEAHLNLILIFFIKFEIFTIIISNFKQS